MANRLYDFGADNSSTHKFVVYDANLQVWDTTANAGAGGYVAWNDLNFANYGITANRIGSTREYHGDEPAGAVRYVLWKWTGVLGTSTATAADNLSLPAAQPGTSGGLATVDANGAVKVQSGTNAAVLFDGQTAGGGTATRVVLAQAYNPVLGSIYVGNNLIIPSFDPAARVITAYGDPGSSASYVDVTPPFDSGMSAALATKIVCAGTRDRTDVATGTLSKQLTALGSEL